MTKPPRVTARAAGATTSPTGTTGAAVAEQARVATRPAGAAHLPDGTGSAVAAIAEQQSTGPTGLPRRCPVRTIADQRASQ